jgi:hypothetical protein
VIAVAMVGVPHRVLGWRARNQDRELKERIERALALNK